MRTSPSPHTAVATLARLPTMAADYIDRHLWTASCLVLEKRRRVIAHALLRSAPSPALAHVTLHIFRRTSVCAAWSGHVGCTTDELAMILRDTVIDESGLRRAFGPRWHEIVDRTVRTTTQLVEPPVSQCGALV